MKKASRTVTPATEFGLAEYSDLFAKHVDFPGDEPERFQVFRAAMLQDLAATSPYETVLAENLICIEWDLQRHRYMRDIHVRDAIREAARTAFVAHKRREHERRVNDAYDEFVGNLRRQGIEEDESDDLFEPEPFLEHLAEIEARGFADKLVGADPAGRDSSLHRLVVIGYDPGILIAKAWRKAGVHVEYYDEKIKDLERRRRDVQRDFERLQRLRPIDGKVETE